MPNCCGGLMALGSCGLLFASPRHSQRTIWMFLTQPLHVATSNQALEPFPPVCYLDLECFNFSLLRYRLKRSEIWFYVVDRHM